MGMYTGIRFKGIIKKEYLDGFDDIAFRGNWELSNHEIFREFGKLPRADMIPRGSLSYMPDEWEQTHDFDLCFDQSKGRWEFNCSLKNYNGEVEEFLEMIPNFVEYLIYLEVRYEEWEESRFYQLVDGQLKEVENDH